MMTRFDWTGLLAGRLRALPFACLLVAACAAPAAHVEPTATPPRTDPDDRDLVSLIPAPAEAVLFVDVAQLRSSPWTTSVLASRPQAERAARAAERGFDEIADVDRMVLARLPGAAGGLTSLELLQGRFDWERIEQAFKTRHPSARASAYRDADVLEAEGESLARITDRTIAAGPTPALRGAVDASYGRTRSVRDEAWFASVATALDEETGRTDHPALEVAVALTESLRDALREAFGAQEDALDHLGARIVLDSQARLFAVGGAGGRADARDLAARVGLGARALAERRSVRALGLAGLLERFQVSARGTRVVAGLTVSEDDRAAVAERVAALAALVAKAREGAPATKDAGEKKN